MWKEKLSQGGGKLDLNGLNEDDLTLNSVPRLKRGVPNRSLLLRLEKVPGSSGRRNEGSLRGLRQVIGQDGC